MNLTAVQDAMRDEDMCGQCHELAPPMTVLHDESGSLRGLSASYAKHDITPKIVSAWATTHRRHSFAMFEHNSYSINVFDYCTDYGE